MIANVYHNFDHFIKIANYHHEGTTHDDSYQILSIVSFVLFPQTSRDTLQKMVGHLHRSSGSVPLFTTGVTFVDAHSKSKNNAPSCGRLVDELGATLCNSDQSGHFSS